MELSADQQVALGAIKDWLSTEKQTLTLGGYAGTGKSTLISTLLKDEALRGKSVAVCAFTGKAASVLRAKGIKTAKTMHKLVYSPTMWCLYCEKEANLDEEEEICRGCNSDRFLKLRFLRVPFIDHDLVIVDESSMLNSNLVADVEELAHKVLYVGDHGQLEPIGDDPGIMRNPEFRLEKIHRQAAESGIIQIAHHMRQGRSAQKFHSQRYPDVVVWNGQRPSVTMLDQADVVLCGYNNTRVAVNDAIRKKRGFVDPLPQEGERLICLQNDSELGIFNGLLVTITRRRKSDDYPRYDFIDDAGERYVDIPMHPEQFGEEKKMGWAKKGLGVFDFGYCLTVHKSQGSEWEKVTVLEQIAGSWDAARWRYTAATRASERLEWWISGGRK